MAGLRVGSVVGLSICGCFVGFILLIFTAVFYGIWQVEVYAEENYLSVDATITDRTLYSDTCSRQHCTGTGSNRHCTTEYYTCYYYVYDIEFWEVKSATTVYASPETSKYEYLSNLQTAFPEGIGDDLPIWYDPLTPASTVRFTEPSSGGWFVAFAVFCVIDVSVLGCFAAACKSAKRTAGFRNKMKNSGGPVAGAFGSFVSNPLQQQSMQPMQPSFQPMQPQQPMMQPMQPQQPMMQPMMQQPMMQQQQVPSYLPQQDAMMPQMPQYGGGASDSVGMPMMAPSMAMQPPQRML